jgi:hypothetical protein
LLWKYVDQGNGNCFFPNSRAYAGVLEVADYADSGWNSPQVLTDSITRKASSTAKAWIGAKPPGMRHLVVGATLWQVVNRYGDEVEFGPVTVPVLRTIGQFIASDDQIVIDPGEDAQWLNVTPKLAFFVRGWFEYEIGWRWE